MTIAQAALESGWGKDGTPKINNYFGIKKGGNNSCSTTGEEHQGDGNGVWGGTSVCLNASEGGKAYFRAYNSISESVQDHSRLFWCNQRYEKVVQATRLEEQLRALASSGYRTGYKKFDDFYYNQILKIINDYHLTKYDEGISYDGSVPDYASSCSTTGGNPFTGKIEENLSYTEGYTYLNLNTGYTGDSTQGYIYQKYSDQPLWDQLGYELDELKEDHIIGNIFKQGEKLYGDGELHFTNLVTEGSNNSAPIGGVLNDGTFSGLPLPAGSFSCSSGFGYRGNIGVSGASKNHQAIDLPVPEGTPVYTVGNGVVTYSNFNSSCGYMVKVDHQNGMVTRYCHLSKLNVNLGQNVSAGDIIALSGNTGNSGGPHLDFQVKINGTAKDPRNIVEGLKGLKCTNGL